MLNAKALLGKILNNFPIAVDVVSRSSFNIAANNVAETTINVEKSGYTPIGVIGWNLIGSGVSYVVPYHLFTDTTKAYYGFRNNSNGQVSVTRLDLYVLYLKLGGGSQ